MGKDKTNKWHYIKLEKFSTAKDTKINWEETYRMRENICNSIAKKQIIQLKMGKESE